MATLALNGGNVIIESGIHAILTTGRHVADVDHHTIVKRGSAAVFGKPVITRVLAHLIQLVLRLADRVVTEDKSILNAVDASGRVDAAGTP